MSAAPQPCSAIPRANRKRSRNKRPTLPDDDDDEDGGSDDDDASEKSDSGASKDSMAGMKKDKHWKPVLETMRKMDKKTIESLKDDVGNLLIFTGLFSAVVTAFAVFSLMAIQPAPVDSSAQLLAQIAGQITSYRVSADFVNSTQPAPPSPTSQSSAPEFMIVVNKLWFSSLTLSLFVAFFSLSMQQWLRYMPVPLDIPLREAIRLREYRWAGWMKWQANGLVSILSLILQLAVALFIVGLIIVLRNINHAVSVPVEDLSIAWLALFLFMSLMPLLDPSCPYKSALASLEPVWDIARTLSTLVLSIILYSAVLFFELIIKPFTRHSLLSRLAKRVAIFTMRVQDFIIWPSQKIGRDFWIRRERNSISDAQKVARLDLAALVWASAAQAAAEMLNIERCFADLHRFLQPRFVLELIALKINRQRNRRLLLVRETLSKKTVDAIDSTFVAEHGIMLSNALEMVKPDEYKGPAGRESPVKEDLPHILMLLWRIVDVQSRPSDGTSNAAESEPKTDEGNAQVHPANEDTPSVSALGPAGAPAPSASSGMVQALGGDNSAATEQSATGNSIQETTSSRPGSASGSMPAAANAAQPATSDVQPTAGDGTPTPTQLLESVTTTGAAAPSPSSDEAQQAVANSLQPAANGAQQPGAVVPSGLRSMLVTKLVEICCTQEFDAGDAGSWQGWGSLVRVPGVLLFDVVTNDNSAWAHVRETDTWPLVQWARRAADFVEGSWGKYAKVFTVSPQELLLSSSATALHALTLNPAALHASREDPPAHGAATPSAPGSAAPLAPTPPQHASDAQTPHAAELLRLLAQLRTFLDDERYYIRDTAVPALPRYLRDSETLPFVTPRALVALCRSLEMLGAAGGPLHDTGAGAGAGAGGPCKELAELLRVICEGNEGLRDGLACVERLLDVYTERGVPSAQVAFAGDAGAGAGPVAQAVGPLGPAVAHTMSSSDLALLHLYDLTSGSDAALANAAAISEGDEREL